MIRPILICIVCVFCTLPQLRAQEDSAERERSARIGLYFGLQANQHSPDFRELPGVPNCCPGFTDGSATVPTFGALFAMPVAAQIDFELGVGLTALDGNLSANETIGNAELNGQVVDAEVEHILDASFSVLSIEPRISWRPFAESDVPLSIRAGVEFGLINSSTFEQEERLLSPSNARFPESGVVRNAVAEDLDDAASMHLALALGVGYEIPLGERLNAIPQAGYYLGLSDLVDGLDWKTNSLRFGVALTYDIFGAEEEVVIPEPEPEPTPEPEPEIADAKPAIGASFELEAIDVLGRLSDDVAITIEEVEITESYPIMFYVYFPKASADLAATRQVLLENDETADFQETLLPGATMEVYRNLLNVIGKRMLQYPASKITLTGHNDNTGSEANNTELSGQRAESVKSYLVDVWGIDQGRIDIRKRNLPQLPSNNESEDGRAENRRVELSSNDALLLQPVSLSNVVRNTTPDVLRVKPRMNAAGGLAKWDVKISNSNGGVLQGRNGSRFVETVDFDVLDLEVTPQMEELRVDMQIDDEADQTASVSKTLPVNYISLNQKRSETKNDVRFDRFSLVLFGFNSDALNGNHRAVLEDVKKAWSPNAKVTIEGYSDRVGDPAYNKQLAGRRIENVRQYLLSDIPAESIESNAIGSERLLYDNTYPEGRNYSRTVRIIIATPVN